MIHRRGHLKAIAVAVAIATGTLTFSTQVLAQSGGTIKVGILHSLSGTMAISETVLKDTVLMAIEEINAKGGVLGKKLEPVIVDPASNWPLFAEKTRQLLTQDKVAVIFGCWTSVSRKSALPVLEELNGLLFYPVQYEGEELKDAPRQYLNRLSDLLFVLSRVLNRHRPNGDGGDDVYWKSERMARMATE